MRYKKYKIVTIQNPGKSNRWFELYIKKPPRDFSFAWLPKFLWEWYYHSWHNTYSDALDTLKEIQKEDVANKWIEYDTFYDQKGVNWDRDYRW